MTLKGLRVWSVGDLFRNDKSQRSASEQTTTETDEYDSSKAVEIPKKTSNKSSSVQKIKAWLKLHSAVGDVSMETQSVGIRVWGARHHEVSAAAASAAPAPEGPTWTKHRFLTRFCLKELRLSCRESLQENGRSGPKFSSDWNKIQYRQEINWFKARFYFWLNRCLEGNGTGDLQWSGATVLNSTTSLLPQMLKICSFLSLNSCARKLDPH